MRTWTYRTKILLATGIWLKLCSSLHLIVCIEAREIRWCCSSQGSCTKSRLIFIPPGDHQFSKIQMYIHNKLWQFPHRQFSLWFSHIAIRRNAKSLRWKINTPPKGRHFWLRFHCQYLGFWVVHGKRAVPLKGSPPLPEQQRWDQITQRGVFSLVWIDSFTQLWLMFAELCSCREVL